MAGRPEVQGDPAAVRGRCEEARRRGLRVAFVPTMGFLHDGHGALLEEGRRRGELLVLSIFVNPRQFGPAEDLSRYPRDLPGDLRRAAAAGVDLAFVPDVAALYPPGFATTVDVGPLGRGLCGDRRPGHFAGVATVVTKLFQLVRPHVALFGEKDYQQLCVIRRLVRDLDLAVEIVGVPIVREGDGLAMSSRNAYLSAEERVQARALSAGLVAAGRLYATGERRGERLCAAVADEVRARPLARLDYAELRDAESLAPIGLADRPAVLAVAAYVGTTRLIDNVVLRSAP